MAVLYIYEDMLITYVILLKLKLLVIYSSFLQMGIFFVDINECEEISDACKGGLCLNLPGTFLCECPEGLLLSSDGQSCQGLVFFYQTFIMDPSVQLSFGPVFVMVLVL